MKERKDPGIKADSDRKEHKANVKTQTTFVRTTKWELVYSELLLVIKASYRNSTRDLSTAINQVGFKNCQKLLETVKSYCLLVIDFDVQ